MRLQVLPETCGSDQQQGIDLLAARGERESFQLCLRPIGKPPISLLMDKMKSRNSD